MTFEFQKIIMDIFSCVVSFKNKTIFYNFRKQDGKLVSMQYITCCLLMIFVIIVQFILKDTTTFDLDLLYYIPLYCIVLK